ncbi:hypothetical protein PUN28_004752 [Cardiocondyla obscurior]|uniref:Uncharacterized protein n=1 Tax=Cardiocondyla obscurior TaxID=286306 RepID=A0AAW2GGD1_9HYME
MNKYVPRTLSGKLDQNCGLQLWIPRYIGVYVLTSHTDRTPEKLIVDECCNQYNSVYRWFAYSGLQTRKDAYTLKEQTQQIFVSCYFCSDLFASECCVCCSFSVHMLSVFAL